MKKYIFYMLILIFTALAQAEIKPHFETYFDDEKTLGARFTTSFSDLRLTTRPNKQSAGAAVYAGTLFPRLPLTVKAGNLSAGGALSTLNSPELTAGTSPFTTSSPATSPLTATLPGYASFSKPVSAFAEASLSPSKKSPASTQLPLTCRLSTWLPASGPLTSNSPTSSIPASGNVTSGQPTPPITSLQLTLPLKAHGLTLSASYTGGLFPYESNATSAWFLKSPYYPQGQHYCALFQFSAQSKKTGSESKSQVKETAVNLTGGLYESPFGFYQLIYRVDEKISTKHIEHFSQIFFNSYDQVLTSSGKSLTPSLQLKTGLLYKSPSKLASLYLKQPIFLRTGANLYSKINLTQNEHPVKANAGLQISGEKSSQSLSISTEGSLISKSPESWPEDISIKNISSQIKSSWKAGAFSPALSLNISLPQNSSASPKYKINASCSYKSKSPKLPITLNASSSLNISPTTQNESPLTKLSSTLTLQLQTKYLKIIGKISFNEDLEL